MGKNKTKRRAFPKSLYLSTTRDDNESVNSSSSNLNKLNHDITNIEPGAYFDHRIYKDSAHIQSSPAKSRRRRSSSQNMLNSNSTINHNSRRYTMPSSNNPMFANRQTSLPLTNKNLKNLLSQNEDYPPTDKRYSGVALDMDKYAKEQTRLASSHSWNIPFEDHHDDANMSGNDNATINSLEFGGSNPSSEHSSDSTSLDDVCFPEYYDHTDTSGDKENIYEWPDLKVLEEYIREELEEYLELSIHEEEEQRQQENADQNVNFQYPIAYEASKSQRPTSGEPRESTPLLSNTKVNEVEFLDPLNKSFRIRPPSIQPWEKSKEKIPTILNKSTDHDQKQSYQKYYNKFGKFDSQPFRFTYFREDLDKTIHSPTISGLIADGSKNREKARQLAKKLKAEDTSESSKEGEKTISIALKELFMPSYYSHPVKFSSSTNVSIHGGASINTSTGNGNNTPTFLTPELQANLSVQPLTKLMNHNTRTNESPTPGTALGSIIDNNNYINPFWLDVLDPTEEEMKVLSKTFGIHPLTTEDIFLGEAREKVELFKSYYFVCFTSFDIIYERRKQRAKEQERKLNKLQEMYEYSDNKNNIFGSSERKSKIWKYFKNFFKPSESTQGNNSYKLNSPLLHNTKETTSLKSKGKKIREGELQPLNMYMIIFKDAVITFHFSATPHPINVRRRARLLRDYLTVSSDWLCYALIDDITDSFAPMIDSIEEEVNNIEDAILKLHSGDTDSDDDSSEDENEDEDGTENNRQYGKIEDNNVFYRRKRSRSTVENKTSNKIFSRTSISSDRDSSRKSLPSSKSSSSKILGWKRKGDMLRRIGECRKRVMSLLRLLGSKADVIKGFNKRFSETWEPGSNRMEIGMYLGDIQDHIITMVQSLNHYEKLLARSHSNYLAQINIDMTKVNNDTNDVLGKITVLGTIVLPINVVTGLWGMNCVVPGQDYDGLAWFWSIICGMMIFSLFAYHYARKISGL